MRYILECVSSPLLFCSVVEHNVRTLTCLTLSDDRY